MKTIKRIAPKSLARIIGIIHLSFGLIPGVFVLGASLIAAVGGGSDIPLLFGMGGFLILPIFYGVLGWIGGYVTAVVYNFFANKFGGIEFEVG